MNPLRLSFPHRALAVVCLLWAFLPASAQTATPSEAPEPPPTPDTSTVTLSLPTLDSTLQVGGRVDVRATLDAKGNEAWAGRLSVPTTRLEFTYRWKKRLRAVVEFDIQDGAQGLKDGYLWLDLPVGFAVRAGQFKMPVSLIELESAPTLPLVRRGLLRDFLDQALGLAGRQPGVQLEWKCGSCGTPIKLRAGVWESEHVDGKAALQKGLGLVPMVRGTWRLGTLELGASGVLQPAGAIDGASRNGWVAGVDAQHTWALGTGELRTWAEGIAGRTQLLTGSDGPFLTGRALAAWRLGGAEKGDLFIEPFVMLSALDPDRERQRDLLWETAGGLNVGKRGLWRLQAQVEQRKTEDAVPATLRELDNDLVPRRAVLVQLEAGF